MDIYNIIYFKFHFISANLIEKNIEESKSPPFVRGKSNERGAFVVKKYCLYSKFRVYSYG